MAVKKSELVRWASIVRTTKETDIELTLTLDGTGKAEISSGVPFFDHMMDLLTRHAQLDLQLKAEGDIQIDCHHTVEDIGICMGQALEQALGDKKGIRRFGDALLPMEEALVMVAIDLSGRGGLCQDLGQLNSRVGEFDVELVPEFFKALANNGKFNLHIRLLSGTNTHHILEAVFKGFAVALRDAVAVVNPAASVPSTKGVL